MLNVRGITLDEWNSDAFKQLHLTSETLTWDPMTSLYEEQEATMVDYSGHVVTTARPLMKHVNCLVINLLSSLTTDQADITDDKNFYDFLASHVQISSIETSLNGHIRLRKTAPIDPQTLVICWIISLERAKQTIVMTTQKGVRTCLNPTLSCRFPTNDRMLWYKRVLHIMFRDTLFAGSVLQQGNKVAQTYAMSFDWARAQPMKHKGDAHETLSLVFQRDGVPPTMVTNDSKDTTKGKFQRKLKEADCHPRVTEPYSPWQQAAEG